MATAIKTFRMMTRSLAFGMLATLIACSPKSVPVNQHETALPTADYVEAPKLGADVKELSTVDVGLLETQSRSTNLTVLQTALGGLERFVLNGSYIEDSEFRNTKQMTRMLFAYNAAAVNSLKANKDESKNRELLEKYYQSVASGCDDELKGCRNIGFFKQDNNSSVLIQELAKRVGKDLDSAKDLKPEQKTEVNLKAHLYYRYLALAFDLKNGTRNRDLEFMYLSHARQYSEYFATLPESAKNNDLLKRHRFVFETILNDFEPNLQDPENAKRFEAFISNFSPWTYSKTQTNAFGDTASERMLDLAAANYIYAGGAKSQSGKLSPSLAEAICRSQVTLPAESNGPADPCSTENIAKTWAQPQAPSKASCDELVKAGSELLSHRERALCLKQNNPDLFNGLHLAEVAAYDEYFYVIDRVFRGDWSQDSSFWAGTHKEDAKLLNAIQSYVRIEVARMLVRTNAFMNSIYSNRGSYSSITLMKTAVEKSLEISNEWNGLLNKKRILKLFMEHYLKKSETSLQSADYLKTDELLGGLERNIKFISVYPNMMLMFYFMTEVNFVKEIHTFFGKVEVPASRFVGWFFGGQTPPFFNFGNDGKNISQLETLFAYYFAMKSETFKAFSIDKETIDEVLFFKSVIGQYLDEDRLTLTKALDDINDLFNESQNYSSFLSICKFKRNPGTNLRMTTSIALQDLAMYTNLGTKDRGYTATPTKFYELVRDRIDSVHKTFDKKLLFVNTMIDLYRTHLETMGKTSENSVGTYSQDQIDAKIMQIRNDLSPIQNARDEFISTVFKHHQEISTCLDEARSLEISREAHLLDLEDVYLKQVATIIRKLRTGEFVDGKDGLSAEEQANAELKTLNLKHLGTPQALPKDYLERGGLSRITDNQFSMSEIDVLLRMRYFMSQVAPDVTIDMPHRLEDTDIYKENRSTTITLSDSDSDGSQFSADAMKNYNGSKSSSNTDKGTFLQWPTYAGDMDWMTNRLKFLGALYKMGRFYIFEPGECSEPSKVEGLKLAEKDKVCKQARVSGDMLVEELFKTAELVDLGTADMKKPSRKLVERIGLPALYKPEQLKLLFLNKESQQPLKSIGENFYTMLVDDSSDRDVSQQAAMGIKNVGSFLFPVDANVNETILKQYRKLAMNAVRTLTEFELAIQDRETSDGLAKKATNIVYETRGGRDLVVSSAMVLGKPVYLESSVASNANTILIEWKKQSSWMYTIDKKSCEFLRLMDMPCVADGKSP